MGNLVHPTMCKCGAIFTDAGPWEAHLGRCPVLIATLRCGASPDAPCPRVQLMYSEMYPTRFSKRISWFKDLGITPVRLPAIVTLNGTLATTVTVTHGWYVPAWAEIIVRQEDLAIDVREAALRRAASAAAEQDALISLMRAAGDEGLSRALTEFAGR